VTLSLEEQIRQVADAAFEQTTAVRPDESDTKPKVARSRTRGRWIVLVAASVLAIALVGALSVIGGTANSPISPVDSPTPSPTSGATVTEPPPTTPPLPVPPDFSEEFSALGMLAEIPLAAYRPDVGGRVEGTDFATISEISGVARPANANVAAERDWFDVLFDPEAVALTTPFLLYPDTEKLQDYEQELGYGFLDIDRFAAASTFVSTDPIDPIDVVALRREIELLADEAGDDQIVDIGSGPDGQRNLDDRTPLRPIGQPLRLGIDEQRSMISISRSTPIVSAWLNPESPTLFDVPDLAAAAAALDLDEELYSAEIETIDRDIASYELDLPESEFLIVEEFSTVGLGWSGFGDNQRTTIVYVFADEEAASASVQPIESLYALDAEVHNPNGIQLDEVDVVGDAFLVDEVTAFGRTVVVSGHANIDRRLSSIRDLFLASPTLIAHR